MTVAFERWKAGTDTRPLYADLPGGACPANHYGYVLTGRARVLTEAGEEILQAGQAYHMPPGHNVVVEEDAELVEFTPVEAETRGRARGRDTGGRVKDRQKDRQGEVWRWRSPTS